MQEQEKQDQTLDQALARDKGQWFVVQTLSGQEMKARNNIERRIPQEGLENDIFEVLLPMEKVADTKRGHKKVVNRKFFPGYLLVRLNLYTPTGEINSPVWYFIKETQGVIGFIGGDHPVPLSEQEVKAIQNQTSGDEQPKPKVDFEVGEVVTIRDGAFENFEGTIESVDPERSRLKLSVTIFGRSTPVEVEYWQVEHNA